MEGASVAVLACVIDDKVSLVAKASKDAVKMGIHAGKIIKEVAPLVGGGGGGRPDMAQAGGKNPDGIHEIGKKVYEVMEGQIG